jgi:hypothetical protein
MIDWIHQELLYAGLSAMGSNPPKSQRRGQALFNHVANGPYAAFTDKIRGTEADCFYDDKKIPAFYVALYEFCNEKD